jgi:type VI protein secretion system component VasK
MGRSIEISGDAIVYLFYASSLAIVPVLAYFVVWPLEDRTNVVVAGLLVLLVFVAVADLWYWKSGKLNDHLSTAAKRRLPHDITYTPSADPGQAVKDYWLKAVRRLPGGGGEDE